MDRAALRLLLVGWGLAAGALGGCNALFGVTPGMTEGQGGAGTTQASTSSTGSSGSASTGSSSSGGCNVYDGMGVTYFTDMPMANVPTLSMGNNGSVRATYYSMLGYTELDLGSSVTGYCGIGATVYLAGTPQVADYVVVDKSPTVDVNFTQGPMKKAYVFAGADPQLPDGGCDPQMLGFGSVAGAGKVTVTAVQGATVKFTVTGVQAAGITDPMCAGQGGPCDGQGTIQVDIKGGEADCFVVE